MKIFTVFGTRPEAIKMAPVIKKLKEAEKIQTRVVLTAQHREMLDQVIALFKIEPDYDLNLMRRNQTLDEITVRVIQGLGPIFEKEKPDLVLVHGDTTTTFAGALTAFYHGIPVGHVEAGLRTGNKQMPYPEEINRRLTGVLADLHFSPTAVARDNLLREGVPADRIFITGNTVIDALLGTVQKNYVFQDKVLASLDFNKRILLVTAHRRENWGFPLREIFFALRYLVHRYQDLQVVFPVHKNPRVFEPAREILGGEPRIHLIDPLDYAPFVNLMARAYLVLTDSGGLQEEAPSLGKPVLVMRETTERPEALNSGTVKLVGTNEKQIREAVALLLEDPLVYKKMACAANPYGDGQAAERIVSALSYHFGLLPDRPEDYLAPSNSPKNGKS